MASVNDSDDSPVADDSPVTTEAKKEMSKEPDNYQMLANMEITAGRS